jgi:hypothetical protein
MSKNNKPTYNTYNPKRKIDTKSKEALQYRLTQHQQSVFLILS